METEKEWFAHWFNSPYYHILYGHRDDGEAEFFLRNLVRKFNPKPGARIIDLACGRGRHSIFLNQLGFDVTGVDLSEYSISLAQQQSNPTLHFEVADLRDLRLNTQFDFALNLFTSFGYFDDVATDEQVLRGIHRLLSEDGYLLIDFLNARKVLSCLVPQETKVKNGIQFEIRKNLVEGRIVKTIDLNDNGCQLHFQEQVQALTLEDFEGMFNRTGFTLIDTFGAYDLSPFDAGHSDRLILIARKNHAG